MKHKEPENKFGDLCFLKTFYKYYLMWPPCALIYSLDMEVDSRK